MKNLIRFLLLAVLGFTTNVFGEVYNFTQNNRLSLMEDPEASIEYKIELIRNAKHHVHIITFFWDSSSVVQRLTNELNKANARGVEVRLLTSFIPSLTVDPLGKGKRSLNYPSKTANFSYLSVKPGNNNAITHNLHEKIFLIDGKIAILGGRNASATSLAGKDIEVLMEGPIVSQVQHHFKKMFDFLATKKNKKEKFSEYDQNFFPIQPEFENGEEARILSHEALIHQREKDMNSRQRALQQDDILDTVIKIGFKKLRTYNYFIIPTQRYTDFLTTNLARGASIEMISNSLESAKFSNNTGYIYSLPEVREFVAQGLELYQWQKEQKYNYVHEKVLIFDEDRAIIGSHNLGIGSTSVSNEIAIDIKSKAIAARLIEVFDEEITNPEITSKADLALLDKQIKRHKKRIKFFKMKSINGFLTEMY